MRYGSVISSHRRVNAYFFHKKFLLLLPVLASPGRYFLSIVLRIQKIGDNKNPPHFIREIKTKGYDAIGVNVFHQKLMEFHPKKGVNGPYTTTVILF